MVNLLIDDGNAVLVEDGAAVLMEDASAVHVKVEHLQDMDSKHSELEHRNKDQDSQQISQAFQKNRDYIDQHVLDGETKDPSSDFYRYVGLNYTYHKVLLKGFESSCNVELNQDLENLRMV